MLGEFPILEIFSCVACVVASAWVWGGPGKAKFRRVVGIVLVLVVLISWGLLYAGMYGGPYTEILIAVALIFSVICFVFPVLHGKMHKTNVI
jgi:hypothetical protein